MSRDMHHDTEHDDSRPALSRRTLLRGTGAVAAAGAVAAGAGALGARSAAAAPATYIHPGMLHAYGELNRAKVRVAAGDDPWLSGWNRLTANPHAQSTWTPNPQTTVVRGGTGENYGTLYNDIHAAYQNALRWKIAGTTAHGDKARDILNAWSARLTTITGNADRFLAAGIYGYQFANVAELMRGYSGFDLARFQRMMLNVFYPLNDDFLRNHNGACITNYWANWDLCTMNSVLAIAILCDDDAKYDQAIAYFKNGAGNGAVRKAIPFVHATEGLAQYQESGRDQGHSLMGIGQLGAFCETAWNQGEDLYGYDDNRVMKCAQYVAKYNLGQSVPFTPYSWGSGTNCAYNEHTVISASGRGQLRPIWDVLHYHYARRRGLPVPYITAMAERVRPEGGGGDYGPNSGGYDQLGFGTLLYAR
ncbi:alginate lyase family protein [Streptomyces phaeoluteigriseus]|uniref:Alginate lyase family protein n=1 Tax=Streptomyces phaeoluteigriseus TaxID=114686 RepID=A0ABY4ZB47_9ACTN|nr:alginate lyase family protein [Streptomyces phaeoluteigriseus]USQ86191.1 alginate lyase family protein [Streptomyces phaeoluteigriseus]